MRDIIYNLKLVGVFSGKTALDIGARNTDLAVVLKDNGFEQVTLIDKDFIDIGAIDCNYIQTDLSDFNPTETFDLVIARHVLPFTDNPLQEFKKILSFSKVCYVTFFGNDDDRKRIFLFSKDEIEGIINEHDSLEVLYKNEIHYQGKLYNGSLNNWHVFTYIIKNHTL